MGVKAAMRGQEATIASYRSPHCASKVILAGDTRQDVSRSEPLERNAPTCLLVEIVSETRASNAIARLEYGFG